MKEVAEIRNSSYTLRSSIEKNRSEDIGKDFIVVEDVKVTKRSKDSMGDVLRRFCDKNRDKIVSIDLKNL